MDGRNDERDDQGRGAGAIAPGLPRRRALGILGVGAAGLLPRPAAGQEATPAAAADVEANKEVVRRLYEEVLTQGDLDALDELVAADFVSHEPFPGQASGREGLREALAAFRISFPDIRYTLRDLVAEGDRVAIRADWTGTFENPFFGLPPTGQQLTVEDIDFVLIEGGVIVEGWGLSNLRQVLGVSQGTGTPIAGTPTP